MARFYGGGIIGRVAERRHSFTDFGPGQFELDTTPFARRPANAMPLPEPKALYVPGSAPVTIFALQLGLRQLIVRKVDVHARVRGKPARLTPEEVFGRLHNSDVDVDMEWFAGDSTKTHDLGHKRSQKIVMHPRMGVCRLAHFRTLSDAGMAEVVVQFIEANGTQPSDGLIADFRRALLRMSEGAKPDEYGFIYIAPAVHALEPATTGGRWLIRPTRAEYHPISDEDAERFGFEHHRKEFEAGADRNLPFQGRRVFCELVDLDLVDADPEGRTQTRGAFSLAGIGLAPETEWESLLFGGRFTAQAKSAEKAVGSDHVTMLRQALVQIGRMRSDGSAEVYDIFSVASGSFNTLSIDGFVVYDPFCNERLNAGAVEAVRQFDELVRAVEAAKLARREGAVARWADRQRRPRLEPRPKRDFPPPPPEKTDPASVVYGLSDEFAKFVTADRIASLEAALKAAQSEPPEDKRSFVRAANRLLDVFGLKVQADDGELYRLHVVPSRKPGVEFLSLLGGGGRGVKRGRGFTRVSFRLVPDPMKPKATELTPERAI